MITAKKDKDRVILTFKDCGNLANSFRRILIGELRRESFNTDNSSIDTNDTLITHNILHNICFSKAKNLNINDKFEINVLADSENTKVLSKHIYNEKTHKPADVEPDNLICHLSKGKYLKIKNITVSVGCGNEHAKYETPFNYTYRDLDSCFINYLNTAGRLEYIRIKPPKNYNPEKQYIFLIPKSNYTERVKKQIENYIVLSDIEIIQTGKYISNNYELAIHHPDPETALKQTCELLTEQLNSIESEQIDDILIVKNLTTTVCELLRYFCDRETECPCFKQENILKIQHPDAKKILQNVTDKILKIISSFNLV